VVCFCCVRAFVDLDCNSRFRGDEVMMQFSGNRTELIDFLNEVAKEKIFDDVVQMLKQGMDRNHVLNELMPRMVVQAMRERDDIISNVDSLAMDMDANVSEHTTIN
jgi:hypothetical protein